MLSQFLNYLIETHEIFITLPIWKSRKFRIDTSASLRILGGSDTHSDIITVTLKPEYIYFHYNSTGILN